MASEHWHPFFLCKTRGAGYKRWRLWCRDARHGVDMPVTGSWYALTPTMMLSIWDAVRMLDLDLDHIAVIRELFPKRHRDKWERFLLERAAFQLQEAARGR